MLLSERWKTHECVTEWCKWKMRISRCTPDVMGVRGSAYLLHAHKLSSSLLSYLCIITSSTAMASKMPLCHNCQKVLHDSIKVAAYIFSQQFMLQEWPSRISRVLWPCNYYFSCSHLCARVGDVRVPPDTLIIDDSTHMTWHAFVNSLYQALLPQRAWVWG